MISEFFSFFGNVLLTLLRNRINLRLTRDEFRQVNISFSQFGEDLIVSSYFPPDYIGLYVDVGAFHPYKFSNTMLLYKKRWSGLNIDCDQNKINEFKKIRPRD